ncbi:MAG: hypothetical protein VB070_14725 [Clostridiaceae bacterium]|nr:hypothetical protein [Clostridiaceae bacterium]
MTMSNRFLRSFRWFILFLACGLILTGCVGQNIMAAAFEPQVIAAASNKAPVLDYLNASLDDLKVIDNLLADADLDLMNQNTADDQEVVTADTITRYLGILAGYQSSVKEVLTAIDSRSTPNLEDLTRFRDSERAMFVLTGDLLAEYEQIMNYSSALITMGTNLESLNYYDANDLEGTYQTINNALVATVDLLKSQSVPSFLQNMNENLIDALEQMNEAVLYTLQAVALNDPLRIDAAQYRMDILTRHFDKIIGSVDQDMSDRESKLSQEIAKIQTTSNGLKDWVGQNVKQLENG